MDQLAAAPVGRAGTWATQLASPRQPSGNPISATTARDCRLTRGALFRTGARLARRPREFSTGPPGKSDMLRKDVFFLLFCELVAFVPHVYPISSLSSETS